LRTGELLLYQRARPFFADVSADTLNLDPAAAEEEGYREDEGDSAGGHSGHARIWMR